MSENPFQPPLTPPQRSTTQRIGALAALSFLAIPAAAIAGGTTCSAIGTSIFAYNNQSYPVFFIHMIAGGIPAMAVAAAIHSALRARPDHAPSKKTARRSLFTSLLVGVPIGGLIGVVAFFIALFGLPFGDDVLSCAAAGVIGGALFCLPTLIIHHRRLMKLTTQVTRDTR